ncbi:uncharacterized protein VP01_9533g1, partial [Puccinia sorghi]
LMTLMEGKVEYAGGRPTARAVQNGVEDKEKAKRGSANIKCYTCGTAGHTSRSCPKNVNVVDDEFSQDVALDKGSNFGEEEQIIGMVAETTLAVQEARGRNNLVKRSCCGKRCLALLDSRAVRSVVGKKYLEEFCPKWEDFKLTAELGKCRSASGELKVYVVVYLNDILVYTKNFDDHVQHI